MFSSKGALEMNIAPDSDDVPLEKQPSGACPRTLLGSKQ